MAASTLGGASHIKLLGSYVDHTKTRYSGLETLDGISRTWVRQKPVMFAGSVKQLWRSTSPLMVSCGSVSRTINALEDASEEKKSTRMTTQMVPNSSQVQCLLTEICDTASIAEFELKMNGFRLYVKRDMNGGKNQPVSSISPPVHTNVVIESLDSNGSAKPSSLAISKPPTPSVGRIQRLLETAADEGLVVLHSPKVGYFRRSRNIKGKRAPPSCKEVAYL